MEMNGKNEKCSHFVSAFSSAVTAAGPGNVFREYIGAEFKDVKFSDVPINPNVHSNVRVGVSLGEDSAGKGSFAFFKPSSIASWSDPSTFAECIGQLIGRLKEKGIISFASIAPFDKAEVQSHYLALWRSYGHLIDYVNFQFYAYDKGTTVGQFIQHFKAQISNYEGGRVLASLASDDSGGLVPNNGFFTACWRLKTEKLLNGIFIWSADDSGPNGFGYEKKAQALLAMPY
ncbi:unnamed protein product [Citrullus colocynthis]|uniref:Chitinase n=1 Tax=Citrullus colocynthis TaxID=252529 RepID=A0ABP0Z2P8_9ROSI